MAHPASPLARPRVTGTLQKEFIRYDVLERGSAVTEKHLVSREAQQIFVPMTSAVDALAAALRTHLGI